MLQVYVFYGKNQKIYQNAALALAECKKDDIIYTNEKLFEASFNSLDKKS
jgi:hypothetical protein